MRNLTLVLLAALLFLPSVGWAQDTITFLAGYSSWGSVTQVEGAGWAGGTASADDLFVIPADATVITDNFITLTTGNITVAGRLVIDTQADAEADMPVFTGTETAFMTVADGGILETAGCYREWNPVDDPSVRDTVDPVEPDFAECLPHRSLVNHTTWTVDAISPCVGAVGAIGDCGTGTNDELFRLYFPTADTEQRGDYSLERVAPAVTVTYKDEVCFFDADLTDDRAPAEADQCFPVMAVDATGPDAYIDIHVEQPGNQEENQTKYTSTVKEQASGTVTVAAGKGETCLEVAGVITGFDRREGDHLWIAGWGRPLRIVDTDNGLDCAGAAGDDAVYLAAGLPAAVAATTMAVITLGIRVGDTFNVRSPARFMDVNTVETDSAWDLDGDITMRATVISGPPIIDFDSADAVDIDDLIVRDAGQDGAETLLFATSPSIDIYGLNITGGDAADGGAEPFSFGDITGATQMRHVAVRYHGGDIITSTAASGPLEASWLRFEKRELSGVGAVGWLNDSSSLFSRIDARDVSCVDCIGPAGWAMSVGTTPSLVTRHLFISSDGSFGTGAGLEVVNLRSHTTNTTTIPALPHVLRRAYIQDFTSTDNTNLVNTSGSTLDRVVLDNWSVATADMLDCGDGHSLTNSIILDPTTSDTEHLNNDLIVCAFDGSAATTDIIENVTVALSSGTTNLSHVVTCAGSNETSIRLGGLFVANWDPEIGAGASYGINCADEDVDDFDMSAGPVCFHNTGATTDSGYLNTHADAATTYGTNLQEGTPPSWHDTGLRDYRLTSTAPLTRLGCGARTKNASPGVFGRTGWMDDALSIDPRDRPVYVNTLGVY